MATRSRIGMVNEDGTVSSIYCHWGGYPSNNGRILSEHYKDREKVKKLISLGDISSLRERTTPTYLPEILEKSEDEEVKEGARLLERSGVFKKTAHTFNNPEEGVTVAYHRDRGDDYRSPRINDSVGSYFEADNEAYGYLFTLDGQWLVKVGYGDGPIQTVDEALAEES